MTTIPNTAEILKYMREQVDRFVVGNIVNDIALAQDAMEFYNCTDATLAERDVFVQIAFKVGTEKEKKINEG